MREVRGTRRETALFPYPRRPFELITLHNQHLNPMKTTFPTSFAAAAFALALLPSMGTAQEVRNGDNNANFFQQLAGDPSVLGVTFNFLGGNDRLVLLRNDDLAGLNGLNNGAANMGAGRDVVITSFNMSGTFTLGAGNDFFFCQGDVNFNDSSVRDILVLAGPDNDLIVVTTDGCGYAGEQGDDIFVSDGSRNAFDGGEGNDTYSAEAAEEGVGIDLLNQVAIARFTTGESLFSIENARGSIFDDSILGDANANRLDGLQGNDSIDGGPGNDTISGGTGTNELVGGADIDTLVVEGNITSKTLLGLVPGSGSLVQVVGTRDGVPFDHTVVGFEQVLENGELKSLAFFLGLIRTNNPPPQQTVIPERPVAAAINGFIAGLTLNGTPNADTLNGAAGHDDLAGFGGNDRLNGGANDDTLTGGAGLDRLTGGANNDTFVFSTALAGSADTVTDYNVAQDTIHIRANLVGNLPAGPLGNTRFKSIATPRGAVDANDRIIYIRSTGELMFDRNGSAAGGRVLIATLPRNLTMVASEVVIIP